MSHRMTVLSRRLERFAVGFSIATFAFFLIGFFAASKTEGQLVFLFTSLASVCLFAAFFLWLAHGFAWAMIPDEPVVAKRPAEALKPAEEKRPTEAMKPAEPIKPAKPMKPAEPMKAAEEKKPVEEKKPAEEVVVEEDPPDAKYTITGRRIY
jgi:outer membrane biosynthesis protein TonB